MFEMLVVSLLPAFAGFFMSKDGRYSARRHGCRCGYVQGWTVFRKEAWMPVWLCPRMAI